jgi:hypothetical protein
MPLLDQFAHPRRNQVSIFPKSLINFKDLTHKVFQKIPIDLWQMKQIAQLPLREQRLFQFLGRSWFLE